MGLAAVYFKVAAFCTKNPNLTADNADLRIYTDQESSIGPL